MKLNLPLHPKTELAIDGFISHPSHALLISGPKGYGSDDLGGTIAKNIITNPTNVISIYPNEKNTITVEIIHNLVSSGKYKNAVEQDGKYSQIFVIYSAETMTSEAQNAFLKLLEEPPLGTMFILVSPNESKLLATIKSRTQIIRVHPIAKENALDYLRVKLGYNEEEAKNIALVFGGEVVTLKPKNKGVNIFENLQNTKHILSLPIFNRLVESNNFYKNREQAMSFVKNTSIITKIALEKSARDNNKSALHSWLSKSELVDKAESFLALNGNIKLALDYLLINY